MSFWLIPQLIIIAFFFVMFLRGSKLVWGVGLLAVTSAVLLNTVFNIFGWETMLDRLGLWYNLLGGLIFGGAAVWLWGLLRGGLSADGYGGGRGLLSAVAQPESEQLLSRRAATMSAEVSEYDNKLIFDQMRHNLNPDEVYDLIFDLQMNENEVVAPTRNMEQTILNIMDLARERGRVSDLSLAVERILTPVPAHHFPRLERLNIDTPPNILRRYLLAFYFLTDLEQMAADLEVDWERLGLLSKQAKVRNLLLYLQRRNRLGELIAWLHEHGRADDQPAASQAATTEGS